MRDYVISLTPLEGAAVLIPCVAQDRSEATALGREAAVAHFETYGGLVVLEVRCLRQRHEDDGPVHIAGQMEMEEEA